MPWVVDPPRRYRVAGRRIVANFRFPALEPFGEAHSVALSPAPSRMPGDASGRAIYRGPGEVGETTLEVECVETAAGFRLEVAGVGSLQVAPDGSAMTLAAVAPGVDPELLAQTAVGPPLLLALALQGSFCLHASGVRTPAGGVAFLGESGRGKSTLAEHLCAAPGGWGRKLADDVLALAAEEPTHVSGAFPQAALAAGGGESDLAPAPLRAIYLLAEPGTGTERDRIGIERLSERDAALLLIRHTMATRLFPAPVLRRHAELCSALARAVAIAGLRYPRRREALPEVAAALAADGALG